VYFLVAEALTNAIRHSPSVHVSISVARDQDRLVASITDDGNGGARVIPGGGLAGLRDRLEALGGEFVVHGDPCAEHPNAHGTRLSASLPQQTVRR